MLLGTKTIGEMNLVELREAAIQADRSLVSEFNQYQKEGEAGYEDLGSLADSRVTNAGAFLLRVVDILLANGIR